MKHTGFPGSSATTLRCNLGVYPLARRTGTQTHRSLLFLQAHGCSQYSARTLSNRHRYMQVIRETGRAPGCVTFLPSSLPPFLPFSLSPFLPFSLSPFLPFSFALSPFLPFSLSLSPFLFRSFSFSFALSLSLFLFLFLFLFLCLSLSLLSVSLSLSFSFFVGFFQSRLRPARGPSSASCLPCDDAATGSPTVRAPHKITEPARPSRSSALHRASGPGAAIPHTKIMV